MQSFVKEGNIPKSRNRPCSFADEPLLLNEQEAEIPVPARLIPKDRSLDLVRALKLSQKMGLLLYVHRLGLLTSGGAVHLLYLQKRATFEALRASIDLCERLSQNSKLVQDFKHQIIELNRRPNSKNFRKKEIRQIGVGYRDKGTLPLFHRKSSLKPAEEQWIFFEDLGPDLKLWITLFHPSVLSVDGLWLDRSEFAFVIQRERREFDLLPLLRP
jgi:hypothetical protein